MVHGNAVLTSGSYASGKIDKPVDDDGDKPWERIHVKLSNKK